MIGHTQAFWTIMILIICNAVMSIYAIYRLKKLEQKLGKEDE